MAKTTFREYKFKFYLNANHFIVINGKEGEIHPHTWEFMVDILMSDQKFVQFDAYEKAIDEYFNKYQNHILNNRMFLLVLFFSIQQHMLYYYHQDT